MSVFNDRLPDRPGSRDFSQFIALTRFLAPYRLRIACAILALVVAAGCVLALGQGLRYVIDAGFAAASPEVLDRALGAVVALAALLSIATYARFFLMLSTGERVIADIRRAVFDRILRFSPGYFETIRTGEVISRLTNDTTLLQAVVGYGFSLALRNALLLAGSIGMLLVTNFNLTLVVLALAPLIVMPVVFIGRRVRRASRASQDRVADVSAFIDEALHEVRTVQAYVHEDATRRDFAEHVEAAYRMAVKRIGQSALLVALVMLIVFGGVGVILWKGGHDVLAGRLSAGDLSAFIFYSAIAAGAIAAISEVMSDLQRAAGATERLVELLATEPTISPPSPAAILPAGGAGGVSFDSVGFSYPSRPQVPALERFSLAIAPGERVALVGPSGAGKSTVLSLLLRFYDPQAGTIRVDGTDIRRLDPRALRRAIAVVPQEPVIFAASVFDNLRYGRPEATRAEAERACEQAFASEFIERLPQKLDTPLGERGVTLSGGQRQRLSIARALLADRPILLLDEATSSLDAASERMVQQALEALERGRTTLVIAHRFSTVQHADRIVVLDRGAIVAQGRHADLMRQGGLYASLAALKAGSIDLYPEYTGTIAREILKLEGDFDIARLNRELAPLGMGAAVRLGFNNGYALAMRQERAQALGVRKLSDLLGHSGVKLGLSQEFIGRADGWPGLKKAYGYPFDSGSGLDHGLAYEAVAAGKIDVMDIYTTDAKIERYKLRVLEDDRKYFPRYDAILLYRLDVPTRFPEAWRSLAALEGRIGEAQMIRMNAAAELEGRSFAEAAALLDGQASPQQAGKRDFFATLFGPDFWRLTGEHLLLVFVSLAASIVAGVPLGVAAAKFPRAAQWILGTVGVIQTIPSLALFAFLIAAVGTIGTLPALIALFLYALLPIVRNTHAGITGIGAGMRQAAMALGLAPRDRLRLIEVPLALPSILAGIKTSAVINVGTATIAAFIGAGGYGERIASGLALNDSVTLLAGAIPAAVLALIVQGVFEIGERQFGWMARARRA